jgi:mono/diheme cytochrome c family protein
MATGEALMFGHPRDALALQAKAPQDEDRKFGIVLLVLLTSLAGSVPATAGPDGQDFSRIERGRYLAIVGDCAACHTRPGSGQAFAGGLPLETPFGTLVSPNITPDLGTGIGAWTDDEFINSLTRGTGRNGLHLYPAMPYTYMTKITRDDALAIRAYLNTIQPVYNPVKVNQLAFPFDIREGMRAWNDLYFKFGTFQPRADKSPEWNRGAYLAEGLMHCGLCHTPKNAAGGDETSRHLQGYALQGWYAPNITNDERRGVGGWSIDDIVAYLKTGHNRTSAASGPMADEIAQSSSKMTDADLRAVAVYLKDQPGQVQAAPTAASDGVMKMGAAIYADECSACHTPKGTGIPELFPSLAGAPSVQQADPASILRVVLRGTRSVATDGAPTAPGMPAFGWLLTDEQVAAVATYIRQAWGNSAPPVSASDVATARRTLVERSD